MAYDADYFEWQKKIGAFGGRVNRFKFEPYLRNDDSLLDFGCGGGFLLDQLVCKEKVGVEINPTARKQASSLGLKVYSSVEELPDKHVSLVISNHALEHVENPLQTLRILKNKIKTNGRLIFVVPHQGPNEKWSSDDIHQHLYTWNPLTLGNLFHKAGYSVRSVKTIRHKWPNKYYMQIYNYFGENLFHLFCKLEAYRKNNYQIHIIAEVN